MLVRISSFVKLPLDIAVAIAPSPEFLSTIHAASPAGESLSPDGGGLGLGAVERGIRALGPHPTERRAASQARLLRREVGRVAGENG